MTAASNPKTNLNSEIKSIFFVYHQCTGLEELLNEEQTDINDVLEIINTMQKTGALPPGSGPISPMSAIGAKLRGLNHK